jgi:hypothetical protein
VARRVAGQRLYTGNELGRYSGDGEPEKVFDLREDDEQRDPVRESHHNRARDKFDGITKPRESENEKNDARHHGDHQQAGEPMFVKDAGDDHDEGSRGPAHLHMTTAE